jgi:hypothetical protein
MKDLRQRGAERGSFFWIFIPFCAGMAAQVPSSSGQGFFPVLRMVRDELPFSKDDNG